MSEVKWIRISTDVFNDEAVEVIEQMPEGDAILVIWFKLLVKAGQINDNGLVYVKENIPYTDEMLSVIFKKPISIIRLALKTFEQFGMIEISSTHQIFIRNWEKHQNTDGLERLREQARIRKQRQREKAKLELLATASEPEKENDEMSEIITKWCDYKKDKGSKLNDLTRQEFKNMLSKISRNDVPVAREIVNKAIANNWNNVFELTNDEIKSIKKKEYEKAQELEKIEKDKERALEDEKTKKQVEMKNAICDKTSAIAYLKEFYPMKIMEKTNLFQQLSTEYDFTLADVEGL